MGSLNGTLTHAVCTCRLLVLHMLSHPGLYMDVCIFSIATNLKILSSSAKDVYYFVNEVKVNATMKVWHEGLIFINVFIVVFITPQTTCVACN